jgi:hypothetical protein
MAYTKIIHKSLRGEPGTDEFKAAAAITPGMVVYKTATGDVVAKHATVGGTLPVLMIATENPLAGKTVDDDYSTSDRVQVWFPLNGDIAIMLLYTSENVSIGDKLESHGDGLLRKAVADTSAGTIALDSVVGTAAEASNVAATAAIKVRIGR